MTLDEAIKHAKEIAEKAECEDCRKEHVQLVIWLEELQESKGIQN